MKRSPFLPFILTCIILVSCQSSEQKEAQKTAETISNVMTALGPKTAATSNAGYSMRATIDGRQWTAKKMYEINESNTEFVHGSNGNIQIGFYISRDFIKVGNSHKLGEGYSADLQLGGDNLMSAVSGEYIITKATDQIIEGSFHFKAKEFQSDKTKEVTEGFFRILLK